jgi:hypothetical protein
MLSPKLKQRKWNSFGLFMQFSSLKHERKIPFVESFLVFAGLVGAWMSFVIVTATGGRSEFIFRFKTDFRFFCLSSSNQKHFN